MRIELTPVMAIVPAFVIARPSITGDPPTVTVTPAAIVNEPLPLIVPAFHADAPPTVTAALPFNVPPLVIVSAGSVCAALLLIVNVPDVIRTGAVTVPRMTLVPPCVCRVPAPLIVDAASNVRESFDDRDIVAPLEITNGA